ncbi:unnamed protein product [Debaryomyces fabryi]|nr:unnamed protein product [Debaryomyces fabryi]
MSSTSIDDIFVPTFDLLNHSRYKRKL